MQLYYIERTLPDLLAGLALSAELAVFGILFAFIWAWLLVGGQRSQLPPIRMASQVLVDFARYTPVLLQLFVLYFGLPLIGITLSAFFCGVAALAFQQGAYLAEIFRGGINSIDKHQVQCGVALGLKRRTVFYSIILPQALIKMLPAIGNQVILLFKDTTIVAAIGIMEATMTAKVLSEQSGATYFLFLMVAVIFIVATSVLGLVVRYLEGIRRRRYGI
ncbi:ABC transporter permease subunit [Sneathiella chungangensis]|uniref:ABC transporter permease subunit n=1 Tax=Sneathiella chungangensis TaxID=1418234 RepID=A0A845MJU7_9PROT|nr:amino acid ABC transporter permease [Sneathiella chungangensis]MZR24343.1 ABC transporter permease subunit [Sneathiella chungangensis]